MTDRWANRLVDFGSVAFYWIFAFFGPLMWAESESKWDPVVALMIALLLIHCAVTGWRAFKRGHKRGVIVRVVIPLALLAAAAFIVIASSE